MNVDTPRVWAPPMVLNHSQRPPLNHDSQIQNQDQIQQNLNLNQNYSQHHIQPDQDLVYPPQAQQAQSFTMNRQQPYDVNTPLSYPPPPPPVATRSLSSASYGQAPQGTPYPPPPAVAASASAGPAPSRRRDGRSSPKPEAFYAPNAAELYNHAQMMSGSPSPGPDGSGSSQGGTARDHYPSSVPRLPPILQVEKQQVTTSATQAASASRRRNEAHFVCPVPGCGSTFTRRFNLRGHLRSHTEERPYVCDWPGCKKGFARQHDCKRHQALHSTKSQSNICPGCKKTFSRLDALNRHLRSEGGSECRQVAEAKAAAAISAGTGPSKKRKTDDDEDWENQSDQGSSRI